MLSTYSRVFVRVRVRSAALSSVISSFKISASALTAQRCSSSNAAAEARILARVKLAERARSPSCVGGNCAGGADVGTTPCFTERSGRARGRQPSAAAIDELLLPVPSSSGGGSSRGGKPAEPPPARSPSAFMSAAWISPGLCCGTNGAERGVCSLDAPRTAGRFGAGPEPLRCGRAEALNASQQHIHRLSHSLQYPEGRYTCINTTFKPFSTARAVEKQSECM